MLSRVLLLCLVGFSFAEVFKIPLKKEVKKSGGPQFLQSNGQRLEYVALDHVFIGTVSLGTPLQDVNVAFDTQSGIFWVPDDKCPCDEDCSNERLCFDMCSSHCCSQGGGNSTVFEDDDKNTAPLGVCSHKNVYNPKQSSTYVSRRASTVETFLNKNITINLAYETFRLGPHHAGGFTTNYLQFGHVNDLPQAYEDAQYDGIFGLGRVGPRGSKAPIKQLADKRIISNPVVTLSVTNGKESTQFFDGVLTVGQIDEAFCPLNTSKFIPVASANKWNFRVFKATLDGTSVNDLTWTARVDPSSPFIHIPIKLWNGIKDKLTHDAENDRYTARCSVLNSLFSSFHIYIGTEDCAVPRSQFIVEYSSQLCELLVRPAAEKDDQWVLGIPFLHERCVVLDYNGRIGISDFK
ncbi:unnamed protein product [Bursaphelenchus xylophilus]|uniref:(pine wood nematode) hypothetical protein n=1 Tax=Bursaphelenchus xylophilus TaxID=6326 RepID=A0A1I7RQ98_BURXY|nr:unnamed protein product [Bursaphelenchus xylophilus]CAG9104239.1 unnamed protein product [Bursaphelenchus xylophilus]